MERIEYFSPITFGKIPMGGISQTRSGLWLPKIRTGVGTYQNIANGVGQLTRAQAITCVVRAYYEWAGKKRGWTQEEIEERLKKAAQLELEAQSKELATEVQHLAELEKQRQKSRENQAEGKVLGVFHGYFQICEVRHLATGYVFYRVKIQKKDGWKKIRNKAFSLGLGKETQRQWKFESFGAATSFISSIHPTSGVS
ncbi:MAG TPA: hypothetical protein V6D48_23615 [Oculatellaceae cyanobacterium]